ncbi:MAG: hypothetical protein Q9166_003765 [cf. Caloplaca sp. 2 TL-2023]
MPSLITLAVLTLSYSNILSNALNLPRVALDQNVKCQNPPYQYYPAGVMLPPRKNDPMDKLKRDAQPPADPKAQRVLCAPGTETFIKLTRKFPYDNLMAQKTNEEVQIQLQSLIGNTWTFIERQHLPEGGRGGRDGVIKDDKSLDWIFERASPNAAFKLLVANAHHKVYIPRLHFGSVKIEGNEVTWGVLRAALSALGEYFSFDDYGWTRCVFEIWDGPNQVGIAQIIGP